MRPLQLVLASVLILPLSGCSGCPTALLDGILVAGADGTLTVVSDGGTPMSVVWPDWHGVRTDEETGRLVLTGPLGQIVAREGDRVRVGGGENADGPGFRACGPIAVGPPS